MIGRQLQNIVKGVAAAQSDSVDLATPCDALHISVAGTLKINCLDGTTLAIPNVPAGIFWMGASRVWTTGTAATGIICLYFGT